MTNYNTADNDQHLLPIDLLHLTQFSFQGNLHVDTAEFSLLSFSLFSCNIKPAMRMLLDY